MAEQRHRATPDLELRSGGDGRTVYGILAPFGQTARVDDGRGPFLERFMPSAWTRTVRERGDRVKMLANHERRQWPLGRWSLLREDAAGLYGEGKISKTQAGDEALELIRDGALDAFSVGFQVVREDVDPDDGARLVLEAKLYEVSLVAFPAYEGAVLQGVRSLSAPPLFPRGCAPPTGVDPMKYDHAHLTSTAAIDEVIIDLLDKARALTRSGETLTGDDLAAFNDLTAEVDVLNARHAQYATLERNFRAGAVESSFHAPEILKRGDPWAGDLGGRVTTDIRSRALTAMERMDGTDQARNAATAIVERNGDDIAQWAIAASAPAYVRAFSKVLANPERGHLSWTAEESEAYRTLERIGSTTNAAGGFAVPTALDPAFILDNVGTSNPYRQISRVEQLGPDGGNVWNGVTSAGVTLSWDTEGGEVSDDSPTLARAAIPIFRLAGFVGASFELIDDAPGYAQEVSRIFMDAVDVAESTAFTKGNGTSEPQGIVTAVYAETSRRSNHATNSTMTVSDIANAQQTLGPRWQSRASWTGSLTYLNRVRQLGSSSYSSWTATLDESISNSILGRPAYEVSDMSTALSSITNTAFVYGDFSHFVIVDKVGGTRLNYVPMLFGGAGRPTGQAGWFLYKRTGSEAVTTTAFVVSSNPGA